MQPLPARQTRARIRSSVNGQPAEARRIEWWARRDLNPRPDRYEQAVFPVLKGPGDIWNCSCHLNLLQRSPKRAKCAPEELTRCHHGISGAVADEQVVKMRCKNVAIALPTATSSGHKPNSRRLPSCQHCQTYPEHANYQPESRITAFRQPTESRQAKGSGC